MKKKRISRKPKINIKKNTFKAQKKIRKKKKIKKFSKIFIIKLCMIFVLIVTYIFPIPFSKNISQIPLKQYQLNVLLEIKSFEDNLTLNQEIFYEFRRINSENKLLEENPNFKESINPDVTVVMTMYNQAHCIYKGLRSVQNQSLKNIEIIIIDDCSEDNSTDVIKEYQKEDPRIILIAHDTNEGKIISRFDGIKKAKGKYITIVDGDDALIHKDILKNSFFIAQKANLDVVEFKLIGHNKGRPVLFVFKNDEKEFTDIIYQPELITKFTFKNGNNYELFNHIICGKFIKNEVFQKAFNYIGKEFTDDYISEYEDVILSVAIFHTAKSFYVMKESGYYISYDETYNGFPKTKMGKCKENNKLKNFGFFKVCKFLVDKNNANDIEKNIVFNFIKKFYNEKKLQRPFDNRHYQLLFYVFDKMLEWNCLNNEQKDYILKQKNIVIKKKNSSN